MVDGATLERLCGGNSTEGSNPSLSANQNIIEDLPDKDNFAFAIPSFWGVAHLGKF